jgi:hypothetical protein
MQRLLDRRQEGIAVEVQDAPRARREVEVAVGQHA